MPVKFGARPRFGRLVLFAMNTVRLLGRCRRRGRRRGCRRGGRQVATLRVALVGGGAGRLLALETSVGGGELVLVLPAQVLELGAGGTRRFDVVLQCAGVAGNVALQCAEPVERDGQRGHTQHHAGHLAHGGQVASQRRPRCGGALGDNRQHEERDGDAQRVEESDEQRGRARVMVRRRHGNGREDRSGTRDEDEAEAQSQNEPAAFVGVARRTQPGEGALNDLTDLGNQETHRQQPEEGDAQPEQEVLREVQESEQRAGEQD